MCRCPVDGRRELGETAGKHASRGGGACAPTHPASHSVLPCFPTQRSPRTSPLCCSRSRGLWSTGSTGAHVLGGVEGLGGGLRVRKQLPGFGTGPLGSLHHSLYFSTIERGIRERTKNGSAWGEKRCGIIPCVRRRAEWEIFRYYHARGLHRRCPGQTPVDRC